MSALTFNINTIVCLFYSNLCVDFYIETVTHMGANIKYINYIPHVLNYISVRQNLLSLTEFAKRKKKLKKQCSGT